MRIRMVEERHGGRYDGRAWPGVGGEWDVPDAEARDLISRGAAVPVVEQRAEVSEARLAVKTETRGGSGTPAGSPPATPRTRPAATGKPE